MGHIFTLDEANRALALVKPIVGDILAKMREAKEIHAAVRNAEFQPDVSEIDLIGKMRVAEKLLNEVEYHMSELGGVGVFLKDLEKGAVDFPYMHEGKMVFLCWMPGEDSIKYWHEQNHGVLARRPVDESFLLKTAVV